MVVLLEAGQEDALPPLRHVVHLDVVEERATPEPLPASHLFEFLKEKLGVKGDGRVVRSSLATHISEA